ncbi:MAG TPA: biotin/lipoyl-binding protein, partial [Holophaga sp.]|nr:biotin/lipoyl-binding protein [Holophaga sp.]
MLRRRTWMLGGAGLLLVLGGGAWMVFGRGTEEPVFTLEQVRRQDLRESIQANGEIQARTRVNVGSTITAEIRGIHVTDGQWVKAGDLLVTLDQERFLQDRVRAELTLNGARQDLKGALAAHDKQTRTFQRREELHAQGIVS